MPTTLKLSVFLFICTVLFFTACTKDNPLPTTPTKHDTVRIVVHDTIRIHDTVISPLSRTQLLTQYSWKVDQLSHVIGCKYSSYIDGLSNTTGVQYQNLKFTFNSDGTGINVDQFGSSNSITWKFLSLERDLQINVLGTNPITYMWQMVELTPGYLHATVNLTISGSPDNMESFRLKAIK